jgi:hypothetical protein
MAEAFHLLSRGGVHFDKKRFKKDVELFNGVSTHLLRISDTPNICSAIEEQRNCKK